MSKRFYLIYVLILTVEIICGELNFQPGVWLLKPLIVLSLIYVVFKDDPKRHLFFVIALTFSLIGDVVLMLNRPDLFIVGLGNFLLTHLLYVYIFVKKAKFKWDMMFRIVLLSCLIYFIHLRGNIPAALEVPVVIYMIIITIMAIVLSSVKTEKPTHNLLFVGSALFIASDAFIAYDRFVEEIPFPTLIVMSTYGIAQLFITKGYLNIFSKKIN